MTDFTHAWRWALSALLTAAVVSTVAPAVAHAAPATAAPADVQPLIGATAPDIPGVTPTMADPGRRTRPPAAQPAFSLRRVDAAASVETKPGVTPDGEGGGLSCTPYVDWEFGDVGEDDFLEETVTVDYFGDVECNFYLWSIEAAAGVYDRSDDFNGEEFDGDIISVGPTYYTEWDDYAYSFGGFGVLARGYNGAREIEPGFEMILEAPEGFVWDDCEPLPGLRYLEPCDGLGTNVLYTLVGAYTQDTGLTKACRDQQATGDVEQARVTTLHGSAPASTQILRRLPAVKDRVTAFKRGLCAVSGGATGFATTEGQALWDAATAAARAGQAQGDDRPLYWARLSMTRALEQRRPASDSAAAQAALDRASRGTNSHSFTGGGRKVLVSGFDPFGLDDGGNALLRGNPSAASVLRLDGVTVGGAEVQAVVFPVRYDDFDARLVESVFRPHLQAGGQQASLITTVSEGRSAFDLEFYNGRNRASYASGVPALDDNRNETNGAGTYDAPTEPPVDSGAQFTQTTLPVDRMRVTGDYGVNVNTRVAEQAPPGSASRPRADGPSLGSRAVLGSGDGYLSNEIAYRVTRLRDELGVAVQAGHVHTPALRLPSGVTDSAFDAERNRIAAQYRQILEAGVGAPGVPAVRLTVDRTTFRVGERPVYTVTGGPNAPITWSGARDGAIVERDLALGHTTNAAGTWTGSWHTWLPTQEGDWVRWARVGGRLASVAVTVEPAAPQLPPDVAADFDADGRTDIALWRPSDGVWHVLPSGGGSSQVAFGQAGDLPVDADFSGDGRTDHAVFRPSNGTWYVQSHTGFTAVPFGMAGDVPVAGDHDRDGRADLVVFRPSDGVWHVLPSGGSGSYSVQFGQLGDVPARGDFDGDDRADLAVFRPSTATWWVRQSSDGQVVTTQFGLGRDVVVPADYDADGRTDLAVFRPTNGSWQIMQSSTGTLRVVINGSRITTPAPGDYDGDGRADFATFTPGSGSWRIVHNSGATTGLSFGLPDDVPVAGR